MTDNQVTNYMLCIYSLVFVACVMFVVPAAFKLGVWMGGVCF